MGSNLLEKAISIATQAHFGQVDKAGHPYILHLLRVMMKGKTEDEMICGVLHDLVEDTDWTFEQLEEEGFPDYIIEALQLLTKKDNKDYSLYIDLISENDLAKAVKLNDLEDNMDVRRLAVFNEVDRKRLSKYISAYQYLNKYTP